jgi:hypothetical protein
MDIYSESGTKIHFTRPSAGSKFDQELVKKYLIENNVYTVERTRVGNWHTDVYLTEVPGVAFNSVHFSDVSNKQEGE